LLRDRGTMTRCVGRRACEEADESTIANETISLLVNVALRVARQLRSYLASGSTRRSQDGKLIPTACRVGDRVLLPPYGGNNVKIGAEEYLLFRDSEILGKLE